MRCTFLWNLGQFYFLCLQSSMHRRRICRDIHPSVSDCAFRTQHCPLSDPHGTFNLILCVLSANFFQSERLRQMQPNLPFLLICNPYPTFPHSLNGPIQIFFSPKKSNLSHFLMLNQVVYSSDCFQSVCNLNDCCIFFFFYFYDNNVIHASSFGTRRSQIQ